MDLQAHPLAQGLSEPRGIVATTEADLSALEPGPGCRCLNTEPTDPGRQWGTDLCPGGIIKPKQVTTETECEACLCCTASPPCSSLPHPESGRCWEPIGDPGDPVRSLPHHPSSRKFGEQDMENQWLSLKTNVNYGLWICKERFPSQNGCLLPNWPEVEFWC